MKTRCEWCLGTDLMTAYHDEEWGVPVHDDLKLFEFLVLDAFQAGLSWSTILKKRPNFKRAFNNFDAAKIARYTDRKIEGLLADPGIVRNRLKVLATIGNAKAFLETQDVFGSFDDFIWQFVDGKPQQNKWKTMTQIPAQTKQSDAMSKALKDRGFRFVGSTICYAFMQAAGLVNDHVVGCYRHTEVGKMAISAK
ncbi:MAG: DNA-3-methyladenine glycosylase I [Gemmatimonadota bacterium]|nr:MAG: DNA-3-methyladenine glycosylase I [Gemmatimonadota bacterium]